MNWPLLLLFVCVVSTSTVVGSKDIPLFKPHLEVCNGPITYQIDPVLPANFIPFIEHTIDTQDACAELCFVDRQCFAAHYNRRRRKCATSVRKLEVTCVDPDPTLVDEDQLNGTLPNDMLIFCYRCHVNPKDGLIPRTTTSNVLIEGIAINETLSHELSRNFILKDFSVVEKDPIALETRNHSGSSFWQLFAGSDDDKSVNSIETTVSPPTRPVQFWANVVFGHVDTESEVPGKDNRIANVVDGAEKFLFTIPPQKTTTIETSTTAQQQQQQSANPATTVVTEDSLLSYTEKHVKPDKKADKDVPLRFLLGNLNETSKQSFEDHLQQQIQGNRGVACSEEAKLPCSRGFGRFCRMEIDADGCNYCSCPIKSPAKGCLGPTQSHLLSISRLLRKVQMCEDGREAQQVTRYYRRATRHRNKDDCVATRQPYCGFAQDVNISRMPRTKDECYYFCFNDQELHNYNYLSKQF